MLKTLRTEGKRGGWRTSTLWRGGRREGGRKSQKRGMKERVRRKWWEERRKCKVSG